MANKVTTKIPELPNTVKGRIKYLRIKQGAKQEELAALLAVSRVMYGYYENDEDKRTVSIEVVIKLAKYYNVPSDFLLCITDIEEYNLNLIEINKKLGLEEKTITLLQFANYFIAHSEELKTKELDSAGGNYLEKIERAFKRGALIGKAQSVIDSVNSLPSIHNDFIKAFGEFLKEFKEINLIK
jgi:transcriptional regulator with XRE-family HTH domain